MNQQALAKSKRMAILSALSEAAERGAPCPTNAELAALVDYSPETVRDVVTRLDYEGHISRQRRGGRRQVTIAEIGKSTAPLPDFTAPAEEARPPVDVGDIVALAEDVFGVPRQDLLGRARPRHIARPRQAVYIVAWRMGWGLSHIGRVLRRDHSTVSHARDMAEVFERYDPSFAANLATLEARARALAA